MRFHFSQFQALLLSSSPGTWPPSLFACDDVGGSEGASAPGAASKSAAALSPAKVCVSSTDAGRRLAAKEAQRRGFLTQFVPVLEKKAVRFSVVKANFLFLFPPTELPEHLWLQQQQARLNGLPQGQAATPSSPLGLWLEDGRHIREGHTSDDELLYDIEVILLEDVQVAPVRKRLTHLSSPDSAFGERFPDEDDVQYEDDLAHDQQQGAGEGPSGKSETGERGQEAKFEYGISLRFAECNEEYFLFAKDRASRQAWLDAVRKASNLRGQLEALVQEASEARFAASRYWARCRALRFEAQKWSSQVQCNAERSHRKLRACDAKEHDKLCERVVMLEELVDSLEGQLVLAEESKTESGLNREVAILQDALLVEAEKTSRLTQILCDVSAALPCDIGEKIRQLVQRLAGDSSPPAPACAPSPSAPAVAAKQKAGPPPPQAKKTEKQTASPPPPQFLKTALHSRSLSARVPHTKLREEEGAEGLARGTRSACLPQGERSKGHARESESKDTTNRPSQDAADSQLQSPALRPHHSPRAFLPVSSACSLRRPVGETVPCRYTEGRSTAASSGRRRRGDTREGDELAFSDGGATRLPCSSLHLCLPDDVVQLPDVCISSASPARFFSQATLGASPTTSSTVGSPPVEAAGKDAVADEPGLAVHVKGGASSDSVAQSPDTTQQAPRAHNNAKSPQARLAEGCAEGQLAAGLASVIQRNDVHLQSPVKLTSSCALPPSKSSTALPPASSKKVAFVGAGPPPASLVPVPSSKGRGGESPRAATPSTSASFCAPSLLRKSPAAVNRDTPAPSGTQPPVGVEAGREEERQKRAPAAPASSMPPSRSPPPPSAAGGLSPPAPASSKKVAFVGAGPPPASLVPVPSSKGRGGESPRAATPSTSASFCAPSLLRKSPAAVNRDTPAPSGTQPPVGVEAGREEERQKRAPAAPASSMPPSRSPPPPSAAGGLSPPAPASSKKVAFVGAGPPPASLEPAGFSKGLGKATKRTASESSSASFCPPRIMCKDISMKQEVVLLTFSGDAGNAGPEPAGKRENASVGETDANHEGFPKTGRDSSLSGLSQLKPATPQGASVKVGSQEGKKEAFLSPSSTKGALAGKGGSPSPGATQSAPEKLKSQVPAPSFKSGVGKASQSPGFEKRFQKAKLSSGTKADLGDEGLPSTTGKKANAGKAIPSSASAAAGVVPSREIQSQSAPAQKTAGGLLEKRSSSPPQRKASVCLADSKQLPAKTPVPAGSASPSTGGAVSSAKRVTTKVSPHLEAAASRPSLPATLPGAKASTPDHLQQPGCTPPAQEEATGTAGCYLGPTEKKPVSLPKKGVISAADAKKGVFVKATLPGKVGKTVAAGLPKSETSSGPSGSKVVTATSTPKSKQLLSAASPAKAGGKEGGVKKERPPGGSPQNGGEGEASQQGGEVREQAKSVPAMALKASLPQPSEKAPQAKSAPTKHAVNEPASSSGLGGGMSAFRDSKRIVSDNVDSKQNHTPVVSPPSLSAPTSLMQHAQVGTESHKAERESDLRPRRSGSHHRRKTHRRLEDFLALLEEEGGADITAKLIKRLEALYSRLGGPPPATFEVRSSQSSSPPSPIDGINPQSLGYVPLLDRVRALAAEAPRVPDFPGLGSVREERAAGSKGSIPAKEGGSEHAEPVVKQARVVEAVPEALEPTRIEAPSPPAQNAAAASGKPAGVDVVQEAEKRASQALAALAARRREEQTARARQTEENQAQVKAERATRTSFDYEPESQREWQRLTRGWSLEGLGVVESLCEPGTTAAITASERPADVDLGVSLFVPVTYEGDNLRRTTVYDPLSDAERLKQEADEGVLGICVRQRRYIIGSHQPPPPVASPILNDSSGDERSQPRGNRRTRRRAARTRLSLMPLFSRQIAMRQHLEDLKAQRRRAMQASHEQHTRKQRRIRRKEPKTQNDDIFAAVRRDRRRLQSHRPFWARLGRNTDLQAGDARSDLSERSSFDSDDEEDEKSCFVARQMVQRNYEQLLNLGMTAGGNRGQE